MFAPLFFLVSPLSLAGGPQTVPLLAGGPQSAPPITAGSPQLAPTVHPALPPNASDLWLVPSERDRAARSIATYEALAAGVKRYKDGDYAGALALVTRPALAGTALAAHAAYYAGLCQLRLGQVAAARRTFDELLDRKPPGYVAIAAALASGEAAEAAGDFDAAVRIYERIAVQKAAVTDDVLSRLGRAALASGDRSKAASAYVRVYYEFPLTEGATLAGRAARRRCRIRSSAPATSSISAARSSCSGRGATPRRARRSRICSAWPRATTRSSSISASRSAISS